jgi:hypothetical protein
MANNFEYRAPHPQKGINIPTSYSLPSGSGSFKGIKLNYKE